MTKIGFIGLGNMGLPMAKNLVKAGHEVTGYDPVASALAALIEAKGKGGDSVTAAAEGSEIIVTMLPTGQHVREVYLGEYSLLAHAKPGTLFIDSSTIDVATAQSVAATAHDHGHDMVDAPVSGGTGGAAAGTLTFMVGGSENAFRRAQPILSQMGTTIIHAGESGHGQAAKICNNMLLGISMIGVAETFALADKLGLDRKKLFEISAQSSGQCWSLTSYCPVPDLVPTSPANREYAAGFTVAMMLKDLRLAQEAAIHGQASTPLGAEAAALYGLFAAAGGNNLDFSAIFNFLTGAS